MDVIELERHKAIVSSIDELIKIVVDESDVKKLKSILKHSRDELDFFNKQNLTVVDITKTEIGVFKGSSKRTIQSKYLRKWLESRYVKDEFELCAACKKESDREYRIWSKWRVDYYSKICLDCKKKDNECSKNREINREVFSVIDDEFQKAWESTIFTNDLQQKHALIKRQYKGWADEAPPLVKQIFESIKLEMEKQFIEQNKELIIKYK